MSPNFLYYPDPGIAFDIAKMLLVKLNSLNVWHNLLTLTDFTDSEISFIEDNAKLLEDPKPELVIFSFVPSNRKTTFLSNIISNLLENGLSTFSFLTLKCYLEDYLTVKKELFDFYFDLQLDSSLDIDHLMLNNKSIPDKIKILLYGFYLYPQKYLSKLITITEKYYHSIMEKCYFPINNTTNLTQFFKCLMEIYSHNRTIQLNERTRLVEYSLSFCVPEFLIINLNISPPFFVTTTTTIDKYISAKSESPSSQQLMKLSQALSDKTRISILNILISHDHMSLDELSEKLSLPYSATKYHLSVLKDVDLIFCTQHFRKNVYSFNSEGFKNIHIALDHMQKGDMLT